jgi:hypothetical protein
MLQRVALPPADVQAKRQAWSSINVEPLPTSEPANAVMGVGPCATDLELRLQLRLELLGPLAFLTRAVTLIGQAVKLPSQPRRLAGWTRPGHSKSTLHRPLCKGASSGRACYWCDMAISTLNSRARWSSSS